MGLHLHFFMTDKHLSDLERAATENGDTRQAELCRAALGVVCSSTAEPAWGLDPMAHEISPLGAVLLSMQPPLADEDRALAHVFGSRPEFHEGIEDGASGRRNISHDDHLYNDGHLLG